MSLAIEKEKQRAGRNRTLSLSQKDIARLSPRIISNIPTRRVTNAVEGTICGDCLDWAQFLPPAFVDLMILDPPYNLEKRFNGRKFSRMEVDAYSSWLNKIISTMKPLLKKHASIYICCDWLTSQSVYAVAAKHFRVLNRITWEREKGRGALRNWKNTCEDIWFCTMSDDYTFNIEAVKLRRRVVAPYTDQDGQPKDWQRTEAGNFRDTHPSNLWTDITIPFWSMPENTDHPTQKSEKLMAKLILASSNRGDFVFDPFLGSGTTSVVAKKLGRQFLGIEIEEKYCLWAEHRLELADKDRAIQGFSDGVFWERNSGPIIKKNADSQTIDLFNSLSD